MPLARQTDSILVLVDIQPKFMAAIREKDRVLDRAKFLAESAALLGIPILATEQYPKRMGGTDPQLASLLSHPAPPKMVFSCCGSAEFLNQLKGLDRRQVVLVGIETHICVNQTAHHLLDAGFQVFVCPDAVSSRSSSRHDSCLARMQQAGAILAHTESIVYEWMQSADHPKFKEVLALVLKHDDTKTS